MAKGQLRSNREKKKPKAERNKKKSAPAISPFTPTRLTGKSAAGRKFSYALIGSPGINPSRKVNLVSGLFATR